MAFSSASGLAYAGIAELIRNQLTGEVTARAITEQSLARIDAFDRAGPALNALFTVNSRAVEDAAQLDEAFRRIGRLQGPLHGIPIVIKDQLETQGLPTSFGCVAFRGYLAKQDATVVARLRSAGAIVIGKSAMPDFGASFFTVSSLGDQPLNPYALERNPGGSSGGSAIAVAAGMAVAAIGEDTGGSIRVPASFNNLVGLRVTTGVLSRAGVSPLVAVQDTPGPMARSVRDVAAALDAMTGYDPKDDFTAAAELYSRPEGYQGDLTSEGASEIRIGVLRARFGSASDPDARPVCDVADRALEALHSAGATLVEVNVPDLGELIAASSLYGLSSKRDINRFLQLRPDLGIRSFEMYHQRREYHPLLDLMDVIAAAPAEPEASLDYWKALATRRVLQRAIVNAMVTERVDVIVFPTVQVVPPLNRDIEAGRWSTLTFPTNTLIASQADLPAISVPIGLTADGLPVGIELVGRAFDEGRLLRVALLFEKQAEWHPPPSTPSTTG